MFLVFWAIFGFVRVVGGVVELTPVRDGEQLGGLVVGHIDDFDGMVVETSDTSGLDAFVAVDDRPILSHDGEALGVLVAVARPDYAILWFEIEIVVGERLEFVDIPPFDPFLWFDDLNDIWRADEDTAEFLCVVDGHIVHYDTASAVVDTFDPSLVGSPLRDDAGVLAL